MGGWLSTYVFVDALEPLHVLGLAGPVPVGGDAGDTALFERVGGWVGGWVGWIEEKEAVRMSCWTLGGGGDELYLVVLPVGCALGLDGLADGGHGVDRLFVRLV